MARKTEKTKTDADLTPPETEELVHDREAPQTADAPEEPGDEEPGDTEGLSEEAETQPAGTDFTQDAPTLGEPDMPPARARSVFWPLVFGGGLSAAVGFGAALYLLPNLPQSWLPEPQEPKIEVLLDRLEAQAADIAAVKAVLENNSAENLLDARLLELSDRVETLAEDLAEQQAAMGQFGTLQERLSALEKAPVEAASPAAIEAYERELAALQEVVVAQRGDMQAQEALRRSAMSQILTSLETGSSFESALNNLREAGVEVPTALQARAGGVASEAALSQAFPEAARAALAAARQGAGSGGIGAFLKTQLNARSLSPRAGSDPDAVLSRMEAAAREGRLGDVLAEAEGLPEAALTPLQAWLETARARLAALDAATALSQQINNN